MRSQKDGLHIRREAKMLDKGRIYGYAKAYLEAQTILLKNKVKKEEEFREVGDACLLQMALNQYEDDLRELEKIMEEHDYE